MDIVKRISELPDAELERLLSALNFTLSGSTIGEAEAFELMAKIEHLANKERTQRKVDARRFHHVRKH